jgi:hypothetical protein
MARAIAHISIGKPLAFAAASFVATIAYIISLAVLVQSSCPGEP